MGDLVAKGHFNANSDAFWAPLCTNFSTTARQLFSGQQTELTEKQDGDHVLQMLYTCPENSFKTSKVISTYSPVLTRESNIQFKAWLGISRCDIFMTCIQFRTFSCWQLYWKKSVYGTETMLTFFPKIICIYYYYELVILGPITSTFTQIILSCWRRRPWLPQAREYLLYSLWKFQSVPLYHSNGIIARDRDSIYNVNITNY